MKKDKKLKRLAENHFFFNSSLNIKEELVLKESKYHNIIKKGIKPILENSETSKETKNKRGVLHPGLDKKELMELIDDVELEFNLDLSNPNPFKYKKIDPLKLKDYIRKYSNLYIKDYDTLNHLNNILNKEDIDGVGILYRLYSAAGV